MREAAAVAPEEEARRTEHRDPSVFPLEWTTCDSARVVWTRHCTDAVPVSPNWHPGQMHPSYRWLFLQLPANPPRPYSTECRCPPLRRTSLSLGREHSRHHRSHYHRRWDIHHFQAYQKLELNAEKKFSLRIGCRRRRCCYYQDCLPLLPQPLPRPSFFLHHYLLLSPLAFWQQRTEVRQTKVRPQMQMRPQLPL